MNYSISLAAFNPYRRQSTIPIYVDHWALSELSEASRFLKFYEKYSDLHWREERAQLLNHSEKYLQALRLFHLSTDTIDRLSSPIELASSLGLVSNLTDGTFLDPKLKREPHSLLLPAERFFNGGNFGSGRHVRIANVELKGTGQNSCNVRSDWGHAWGGLSLESLEPELIKTYQVSSSSPLGAIPVLFASIVKQGNSPALLSFGPSGQRSTYLVLSIIGRSADHTRLAGISFGPRSPRISLGELTSMSRVIDQYASLTAYGHIHYEPNEDNLTLDGRLLDTGSVLSPFPDIFPQPLLVFRRKVKRKTISIKGALTDALKFAPPLEHISSSAVHLKAITSISEYRTRLGVAGLPRNWEDVYLERIGFYWLLRLGYSVDYAEQNATFVAKFFNSQFDSFNRSKKYYFGRYQFKFLGRKPNVGELYFIEQNIDKTKARIRKFMRTTETLRKRLICSYNSRNEQKPERIAPIQDLRGTDAELFDRFNSRITKEIITGRYFNPDCAHRTLMELELSRFRSSLIVHCPLLNDKMEELSDQILGFNFIVCYLNSESKCIRATIPAKWRKHSKNFSFSLGVLSELILEGVELVIDSGRIIALPLPLTYWGGYEQS